MVPKGRPAIDITDLPELARIAEDVRASGEPRVLQRAGEDVAILLPGAGAPGPR